MDFSKTSTPRHGGLGKMAAACVKVAYGLKGGKPLPTRIELLRARRGKQHALFRVGRNRSASTRNRNRANGVRGEGKRKGNTLSNSTCEPHDRSRHAASVDVGLELRGAAEAENIARRDRRVRRGNQSRCTQPAPLRADRACSSPKQTTQRECVSSPVMKWWARMHASLKML
ncbi:E3 ubiquitin-protein ligase rnf213-alpha-like, partial [Tachysurus ichikawai]